jgi:16S rRNA (guanine966-N2)-methyltransferase
LGPIKGHHAIDLFAGTGALGLEALSRGAAKATFLERHLPTAKLIERNIEALKIGPAADVVFADAFHWSAGFRPEAGRLSKPATTSGSMPQLPLTEHSDHMPLTVFCSPPFDFYVERREQMLELIGRWVKLAPAESQIVVEADERFEMGSLPEAESWDVREYLPAVVAVLRK